MLDLSRVFDIEYSALQMMMESERHFAEEDVTVWLAGLNPDLRNYIRASGFADRLGRNRLFANARAAVRHYLDTFAPAARPSSDPAASSGASDGPDPENQRPGNASH